MKKLLLTIFSVALFASAYAQVPFVSVHDINFVSSTDLANCNDTSAYLNDTVKTIGIVVVDGNLSEVASSSVPGGNRPFIFIVDTANGGSPGPFKGIEVMGTNAAGSLAPPAAFTQVLAGDVVQITGVVGEYNNSNQLSLLDANSFSVISSVSAPADTALTVGDFNDANRVNNLQTGEPWEAAFVTLTDVTVVAVNFFSGNSRVSFDVVDANGNRLNVSDRFLAQRLPSHQTVNPNSPQQTGSFVPPVPGTFYNSISGLIRHDANGCTGGTGRGYEINPFDSTHYNIGFAPPFISAVERDPLVPTSNQSVDMACIISDFDGTLDSVIIAWSDDPNLAPSQFPKFNMNLKSGSTDEFEYTIPNKPNNTFIRYYIYAEDNDGNGSYYPTKPLNQVDPNVEHYFVRDNGLKIFDVQFTLNPTGSSSYEGEEVTVTGIVTASTKQHDLGYLYLQDEGGSEWSGIWCVGIGLSTFFRDEEVTVKGTVEENFGMTRINVSQASKTGNKGVVTPTVVDPTDSAGYANFGWEKWEGVLVRYEHPQAGQQLQISQQNLGFGDYAVGASDNAPLSKSGRILAGRQSSTSSSSLYVQLVTDTSYATQDGFMNVPAIAVSDTMKMDAIEGVLFYGFSNFRLLPRNNDDFININVPLDSTNLPTSPIAIKEFEGVNGLRMYPNPTSDRITIAFDEAVAFTARIFDLNGKLIQQEKAKQSITFSLGSLPAGMYLIGLENEAGAVHFARIVKTK